MSINTHPGLVAEQKFTQPPPRYTDASLVKKCDTEQISRPATFHTFVETLKKRDYVKQKKKSFEATELGMKVVDFLKEADVCFVDIKFTAAMESLLDSIQEAKKTKSEVLSDFWKRLKEDIKRGKEIKHQKEVTTHKCPKCDGFLLSKHSKWGPFFICSHMKRLTKKEKEEGKKPDCDYIAKVGEHGEPVEKVVKKTEYLDFKCKKCGSKMVKRKSKFGEFGGCQDFPKCRATADLEGNFKEAKKKWKKSKGE